MQEKKIKQGLSMKSIRSSKRSSRVTNKESSKESRTRNRRWCNCTSSKGINRGSSWRSSKESIKESGRRSIRWSTLEWRSDSCKGSTRGTCISSNTNR